MLGFILSLSLIASGTLVTAYPSSLALSLAEVHDPPASEGYLTGADGVRIFFSVTGAGPDTVIVLHDGPGGDLGNVAADLALLGERLTLVFYDQRGGGRSEAITDVSRLTAQDHVRDLDAVREHFGLGAVSIIGHSWGSGLAALYAFAYPERVDRLVLVGSIPASRVHMEEFRSNIAARLSERESARRLEIVSGWSEADDPEANCREFWKISMTAYLADPGMAADIGADMCGAPPETRRNFVVVNKATIESLSDWDWRPQLAELEVPVLVVHGAHDPIPIESAREWAEAAKHGAMFEMPGAGHFPHAERPEDFVEAVIRYFESG